MVNSIKSVTIIFYAFALLAFFATVCVALSNDDHDTFHRIIFSSNLYSLDIVPRTICVEEKPGPSISAVDPSAGLKCSELYSVKKGDTCFAVYTRKNMTAEDFFAINPNVKCRHLFIGQWLCTIAIRGN
ncbi:hypothetical protein MLD38_019370 [Melastoma candidum]|uniref:Uncharacterized protein n=1 Tax=Melastoma candidum TaxID=119954 RepID=A0ACB9QVY4_9MYRT|nr:hypothetical protein MLD38_019370 [Melastoma candidum]